MCKEKDRDGSPSLDIEGYFNLLDFLNISFFESSKFYCVSWRCTEHQPQATKKEKEQNDSILVHKLDIKDFSLSLTCILILYYSILYYIIHAIVDRKSVNKYIVCLNYFFYLLY